MTTSPAPSAKSDPSPSYIPALDGLRAVAILLVIPHNADMFGATRGVFFPIAAIAHAGWIGVQLFFVLSGFLITRNLLALRGASNYFRAFFGRRVLRIFPLYFSTLIVAFLILPHLINLDAKTPATQTHQIWLWTFLSNWAQPFGLGVEGLSHFWSLAVEEQFYLIWPFVILACSTQRVRSICVALTILALLIRIGCVVGGVRPEVPYMFTVCRMDALAAGALIATLTSVGPIAQLVRARQKFVLLTTVTALLLTSTATHIFDTFDPITLTIGQSVLSAGFAIIVWLVANADQETRNRRLFQVLNNKTLRSVGKYSFAMYIFHLPIAVVLGPWIARHLATDTAYFGTVDSALVIVASYIAGAISYYLLERHFLRLKVYFVANNGKESRA